MITFKQFLKQKNLYGAEGNEFNDLYNSDMNVIDPDLETDSSHENDDVEKDDVVNVEVDNEDELTVSDAEVTEDGEAGASVPIAPSVSGTVSGTDGSMGGTTSADIASVPYGLTKNKEDNTLIARLDAYL